VYTLKIGRKEGREEREREIIKERKRREERKGMER
jgi:hypothetical protein